MCTAAIPRHSMSSWDLNRDNTFKCVPLSGIGNYETPKVEQRFDFLRY